MNLPSFRDLGAWSAYGTAGLILAFVYIGLLNGLGVAQEAILSFFALVGLLAFVWAFAVLLEWFVTWWTTEADALGATDVEGWAKQ